MFLRQVREILVLLECLKMKGSTYWSGAARRTPAAENLAARENRASCVFETDPSSNWRIRCYGFRSKDALAEPRLCRKRKLASATGQSPGADLAHQSAKYCIFSWPSHPPGRWGDAPSTLGIHGLVRRAYLLGNSLLYKPKRNQNQELRA